MMIIKYSFKKVLTVVGLVIICASCGCKDEFNLPYQPIDSYTSIYMPQGVNGPVTSVLKVKDILQTLTYGAVFGGQGFPDSDIPVSFSVDNSLVTSYNLLNKTDYQILPNSAYSLSALTAVIPKGATSTTPLSITFKTFGMGSMEPLKTYLLPISVSSPSIKVNPSLKTVYYILKAQPDLADYPIYDKASWSILGFSSQEANGEGPNNGKAIFILDGKANSFWHTQWQGGSPGPPHYLIIDMGEIKTLHGLAFLARQGDENGKPNEINVQISIDNLTWTDAGSFSLLNNKNLQSVFLPNGFKTARYFKVNINSSFGASYTHLAELSGF